MPATENAGIRIRYEIEGSGPTALLHHGTTQQLERWHDNGLVDARSDQFRVVLFDARGHGQSDKPHDPESYLWDKLIGDVLAVADAGGEKKINLLG